MTPAETASMTGSPLPGLCSPVAQALILFGKREARPQLPPLNTPCLDQRSRAKYRERCQHHRRVSRARGETTVVLMTHAEALASSDDFRHQSAARDRRRLKQPCAPSEEA